MVHTLAGTDLYSDILGKKLVPFKSHLVHSSSVMEPV